MIEMQPPSGTLADRTIAIDAGLRAYMLRVYNYMAMGVGLTSLVADADLSVYRACAA